MANDYQQAAAWCEEQERECFAVADYVRSIACDEFDKPAEREQEALSHEADAVHATLAARAVRAFEALASGRVSSLAFVGGLWQAVGKRVCAKDGRRQRSI